MSLYVVERNDGEWEGATVMAVCSSREKAWKAKRVVMKFLKETNRKRFFIKQIVPNTVYPFGIEDNRSIVMHGTLRKLKMGDVYTLATQEAK